MIACRTALGLLIATALAGAETPSLLIVPSKKAEATGENAKVLGNLIAQELDEDGRVTPIFWSLTDPLFRDASFGRKIGAYADFPEPKQVSKVAAELRTRYVFTYYTEQKPNRVMGTCQLFQGGRLIWKDSENQLAGHQAGGEHDDGMASIAHTWVTKMESTPLRSLTPHPKAQVPQMPSGQAPTVQPTAPTPPPTDTATIQQEVHKLVSNDRQDAAVMLLRDSIDARPLVPDLRLMLVHLLESQGNWSAAAEEAQRGSEMVPDNQELRFAVVRDLLKAGRKTEARNSLNEILARKPGEPGTLLLEAQIDLAIDSPAEAVTVLDKLIQSAPSAAAYFWRALARSMLGGADGVGADLAAYAKKPMDDAAMGDAYPVAIAALSDASEKDLQSVLPLFQSAAAETQKAGGNLREQVAGLSRTCSARGRFYELFVPPAGFKESHSMHLLTQRLLAQALADLDDFIKTGSDDSMTDGRISLGEAMKESKVAHDAFASEIGGVKHTAIG